MVLLQRGEESQEHTENNNKRRLVIGRSSALTVFCRLLPELLRTCCGALVRFLLHSAQKPVVLKGAASVSCLSPECLLHRTRCHKWNQMENTPSEKGNPFRKKTQHKDLQALWQTPQTEMMFVIWMEMQKLQRLQHFAALTEVASRCKAHMGDHTRTKLDICLFKTGYRCPKWCGAKTSFNNTGNNTTDKTRHAVNPRHYTNWSLTGRVWNANSGKYQSECELVTFRMCICRKQSLFVMWEMLHAEFQQKGWALKKEETERRERSELSDGEILKDSCKCVGREWFHYLQRECFL